MHFFEAFFFVVGLSATAIGFIWLLKFVFETTDDYQELKRRVSDLEGKANKSS